MPRFAEPYPAFLSRPRRLCIGAAFPPHRILVICRNENRRQHPFGADALANADWKSGNSKDAGELRSQGSTRSQATWVGISQVCVQDPPIVASGSAAALQGFRE